MAPPRIVPFVMARMRVRGSLPSRAAASANGTTGPPGVVSTPGGGCLDCVIVGHRAVKGPVSSFTAVCS